MKLVDLSIYGYGRLENVEIKNLADFQVFFGENEAGKSTMMAFIHGILFGFPTRQQTAELRYEPKNNAKYGGKVRIYHEQYGYVVIERVKGKAAGDVTVSFGDGTTGGEELLKPLLSNFDKGLYQAVFSFNLHGLQNIHQMKGEEIGRFLFSAGTLGTEKLAQAETVLQKELDNRFKPGGKKPYINEQLQALRELNGELKKASEKTGEYEQLIEKKEKMQNDMEKIDLSIRELKQEAEKLNEWKRIESLVREEEWLRKELKELGEIHFPARGLERVEMLNQTSRPLHAQISSLSEKMANLKQEIADSLPNLSLLECESEMLARLDRIPIYDQLKLEKQQNELKLNELTESLATIKEKLHLSLSDNEIFRINTNIYMQDQVGKAARRSQKLNERKQELEDQFQEEKAALEEMEKEFHFMEGQVLSETERSKLEEKVQSGSDKKSLEVEYSALKDKIAYVKQQNQREKDQQKQKLAQLFIFELLLLGLSLYGFMTRQWVLAVLGVTVGLMLAVLMGGGLRRTKESSQTLEPLYGKEKQLQLKLESPDYHHLFLLEEQLQLDNGRRSQLQEVRIKLEHQQNQYEKVITKFEEWEKEAAQHKKTLSAISRELKIPDKVAETNLQEAFQLIDKFKTVGREKQQVQERNGQIQDELAKIEEEVGYYSSLFLQEQERSVDIHKSVYLLRGRLKEEQEKQIKSREKQAELTGQEADCQQLKREYEQVLTEKEQLLREAGAPDEQSFYKLGKKAEQQEKTSVRLRDLQKQLQHSMIPESERERLLQIHHVDELITDDNQQLQDLQEQLKQDQKNLASIQYEIQVLEEGGVYSAVLHQFKQKKYEAEEAAREWAVYAVAQDILTGTIEKYKNVHLPKMLSKAEEYLAFLTNGSYSRIHLQKSGTGFIIERTDHTLFEANELSQATAEQVYVSIRLALATTLYETYRLPIIIDDSFVNFDEHRLQKVLELLKSLKQNQILFFTCHQHMLKNFSRENIIRLEKGAVQFIS